MDELGQRLERFAREGTATEVPPSVSRIRRRAHRRRRRQVTGTLLAAALVAGLALGPGQSLTRLVDKAGPTGPVSKPPSEQRAGPTLTESWIEREGMPIPPVVLVAQGVFEGRRWQYLAFRTDRGKVCGQWHYPDIVEQRSGSVIEVDGRRFVPGGGCGFTFGTSGFSNGNRSATDFEASLPASYARIRITVNGGSPIVLSPPGRKAIGRGFIALRLPDLRRIHEMIAYDEQGRVVFHGIARFTSGGLDFTPARSK
ncbi:MAG TPA: hypothetical protein VFA45_16250 [Actinomycetes bacterium]|jgi:hypothetical protein|nr:hypothetical protein [Actinomycetes bacterium]